MSKEILVNPKVMKYIKTTSISVAGHDEIKVWLKVGVQKFLIANAEDDEHAEFFVNMLSKALSKIIEECEK